MNWSPCCTRVRRVGVPPSLPVEELSLILGNDLVGGRVTTDPCVTDQPTNLNITKEVIIYPAYTVTQAMANKKVEKDDAVIFLITTACSDLIEESNLVAEEIQKEPEDLERRDPLVCISETLVATKSRTLRSQDNVGLSEHHTICLTNKNHQQRYSTLNGLQQNDPSLSAAMKHQVSEAEVAVTCVCYYTKDGIVMRKWSPLDMLASKEWRVVNQIVVPKEYQMEVLHLRSS